jgi:hypothetical protein
LEHIHKVRSIVQEAFVVFHSCIVLID